MPRTTKDQIKGMRKMRVDGASYAKIAAAFGVSTSTAARFTADIDKPKSADRIDEETREVIREKRRKGWTYARLQAEYGLNYAKLHPIVADIDKPKQSRGVPCTVIWSEKLGQRVKIRANNTASEAHVAAGDDGVRAWIELQPEDRQAELRREHLGETETEDEQ